MRILITGGAVFVGGARSFLRDSHRDLRSTLAEMIGAAKQRYGTQLA
jgi:hypothetical protein